MDRVIRTIVQLGLGTLAGVWFFVLPSFADERQDCRQGNPAEVAIAACTKLLEVQGGSAKERAELLLDRGNASFRQRKYDEALADYDEALRIDEGYGLAYNNRGRVHFLKKDFERAVADFDRAIVLLQKFATAFHNRGEAHLGRGDLDKALADFDAALSLNKSDARSLLQRAKTLQQKKEFARALADIDAVIALDAKNKEAGELRAALRLATLPPDVAICTDQKQLLNVQLPACRRVIEAKQARPEDLAFAYNVRAEHFSRNYEYDNAITDFSESIRLHPTAASYSNRGIRYHDKGDTRRAIADFDEALRLDPRYAFALNNRGNAYTALGDLDRAIADYDAAMSLSRFAAAYLNRGRANLLKGDLTKALADYDEGFRINPKSVGALAGRCSVRLAMRQFDLAIEQCDASLAMLGSDRYVDALKARADAYREKGDLTKALADYDRVLNLNPNFVLAYVGRAQLYELRNDPTRARADYRSAAFAVTRYDGVEIGRARSLARERLEALGKAQGPVTPGRRIALVIGNTAYKTVSPLENPVRDAAMIAQTLRSVGFQSVTVANDLGRNKFFETLRAFATEAEKADWAVIYFAGHGLEIGGINYLVPVDAKLRTDADAAGEAVALEQVIASVQGAKKLKLVILDACRDNPFVPKMQRSIALRLVNKGLSNIEPDAGFMVVYGAKHGETALDGEGKNSPFASAIARNMKTPGIEMRKFFDIVRDDVVAATSKQQQPFSYGSLPGREDFFFVAAK